MSIKIHSELDIARATFGASGLDLRSNRSTQREIQPMERWLFPTGVRVSMPFGVEAQVRGRSGLALNHGIVVPVGTIDSDYRGEIKVILINLGRGVFTVHPGDRIAQLVFQPVVTPADVSLVLVDDPAELGVTARGDGGFGSTGAT